MAKRKLTTKQSKGGISTQNIVILIAIAANINMILVKTNILPFIGIDLGLIILYLILRNGVQRKELIRQGGWFKLIKRYGLLKTIRYIFDADALNR